MTAHLTPEECLYLGHRMAKRLESGKPEQKSDAITLFARLIPRFPEAQREAWIGKIEAHLKDSDSVVRKSAIQILGGLLDQMEPSQRLPRALKIAEGLGQANQDQAEYQDIRNALLVDGRILSYSDRLAVALKVAESLDLHLVNVVTLLQDLVIMLQPAQRQAVVDHLKGRPGPNAEWAVKVLKPWLSEPPASEP